MRLPNRVNIPMVFTLLWAWLTAYCDVGAVAAQPASQIQPKHAMLPQDRAHYRAITKLVQLRRTAEASQLALHILEVFPLRHNLHFDIGRVLLNADDCAAAAAYFQQLWRLYQHTIYHHDAFRYGQVCTPSWLRTIMFILMVNQWKARFAMVDGQPLPPQAGSVLHRFCKMLGVRCADATVKMPNLVATDIKTTDVTTALQFDRNLTAKLLSQMVLAHSKTLVSSPKMGGDSVTLSLRLKYHFHPLHAMAYQTSFGRQRQVSNQVQYAAVVDWRGVAIDTYHIVKNRLIVNAHLQLDHNHSHYMRKTNIATKIALSGYASPRQKMTFGVLASQNSITTPYKNTRSFGQGLELIYQNILPSGQVLNASMKHVYNQFLTAKPYLAQPHHARRLSYSVGFETTVSRSPELRLGVRSQWHRTMSNDPLSRQREHTVSTYFIARF